MSEDLDREEVTALKSELSLMSYRLSAIETKLDESLDQLSSKIDLLLERYSATREKQALDSQALAAANQEIFLDVKYPKLYKKIKRYYSNEVQLTGEDPDADYNTIMECIKEDLEVVA